MSDEPDDIEECLCLFLIFEEQHPEIATEIAQHFDDVFDSSATPDQLYLNGMALLLCDLEGLSEDGGTSLHQRPVRPLQALQAAYEKGFKRAKGESPS